MSLIRLAVAVAVLPTFAAAETVTARKAASPPTLPQRQPTATTFLASQTSWSLMPSLSLAGTVTPTSPLGRMPLLVSTSSRQSLASTRFWLPTVQPLLLPWVLAWAKVGGGDLDLAPEAPDPDDERVLAADQGGRELRWLLRHKRRSVLESRRPALASTEDSIDRLALERLVPWLPNVVATVEYAASPSSSLSSESEAAQRTARLMRLEGRGLRGRWLVGGVIYPSATPRWRTLSRATFEPLQGHTVSFTTAWANRPLVLVPAGDGPLASETLEGVVLISDEWQIVKPLALSLGARYSHAGFSDDPHHVDPSGAIEWSSTGRTSLRASVSSRTLIPGGGSLALPLFDPIVPLPGGASVGHSLLYELQAECSAGSTRLTTRAFRRSIRDPFVTAILDPFDSRARTIAAGRRLDLQGVGASVSGQLGSVLQGSLAYSFAHAQRVRLPDSEPLLVAQDLLVPEGNFHDFVGRLATHIDPTDTQVVAFSRLVTTPEGARFRYELQLRQAVPFIAQQTGTEWTVVLAVRNLLQDPEEQDGLAEIADADPPRRVIGGVSVRF